MAMLFARISQSHGIAVSTVREYAQQRDIIFDAAVPSCSPLRTW
jgi:hypothetical protein